MTDVYDSEDYKKFKEFVEGLHLKHESKWEIEHLAYVWVHNIVQNLENKYMKEIQDRTNQIEDTYKAELKEKLRPSTAFIEQLKMALEENEDIQHIVVDLIDNAIQSKIDVSYTCVDGDDYVVKDVKIK